MKKIIAYLTLIFHLGCSPSPSKISRFSYQKTGIMDTISVHFHLEGNSNIILVEQKSQDSFFLGKDYSSSMFLPSGTYYLSTKDGTTKDSIKVSSGEIINLKIKKYP